MDISCIHLNDDGLDPKTVGASNVLICFPAGGGVLHSALEVTAPDPPIIVSALATDGEKGRLHKTK